MSTIKLTAFGDGVWGSDTATITICNNAYLVSFNVEGCNGPCLTLQPASGSGTGSDPTFTATRDCCGANYANFSIGNPSICTDRVGPNGGIGNTAQIQVYWAPCYQQAYDVSSACCPDDPMPEVLCSMTSGVSTVIHWTGEQWCPGDGTTVCGGFDCGGGPPLNWQIEESTPVFPCDTACWNDPQNFYIEFTSEAEFCGYQTGETMIWTWSPDDPDCTTPPTTATTTCSSTYAIPRVLTVTKLTGCSGCSDTSDQCIYNFSQAWLALMCPSGVQLAITIQCTGSSWIVYWKCGGGTVPPGGSGADGSVAPTSVSYDPFVLDFTIPVTDGSCCPVAGATFMVHE